MIQAPSWRPDLRAMADIAEEVARYYGYNRIATTAMCGEPPWAAIRRAEALEKRPVLRQERSGTVRSSPTPFVSPTVFDQSAFRRTRRCAMPSSIINPWVRTPPSCARSSCPAMLDILPATMPTKTRASSSMRWADLSAEGGRPSRRAQAFDLRVPMVSMRISSRMKGREIDALLAQLNILRLHLYADTKIRAIIPAAAPRCGSAARKVGVLGQIHPLVAETYGIGGDVYMRGARFRWSCRPISRRSACSTACRSSPGHGRSALVCDEAVTVGVLEACITRRRQAPAPVQLFDIYRGPGIARQERASPSVSSCARTTARSPTRTPPA